MAEPQRLQKILAHLGVASRRQVEAWILAGRVRLNGQIVTELGTKADPERDQIQLDDRILSPAAPQPRSTLLLHKPTGILSTCHDPQGRPSVLDLLPPEWRGSGQPGLRLYPIGRLDADSSGALLLTNDGDLALQLSHPRYHLPKTYRVEVVGCPNEATLERWRRGVTLGDGPTLPAQVQAQAHGSVKSTILKIILYEGRNRQIRRMAEYLGHPVIALHREAIGSLALGSLESGRYRPLSQAELATLKRESLSPAGHVP